MCVSTENWEIATITKSPLRAIYKVDIAIYLSDKGNLYFPIKNRSVTFNRSAGFTFDSTLYCLVPALCVLGFM